MRVTLPSPFWSMAANRAVISSSLFAPAGAEEPLGAATGPGGVVAELIDSAGLRGCAALLIDASLIGALITGAVLEVALLIGALGERLLGVAEGLALVGKEKATGSADARAMVPPVPMHSSSGWA